MSISNELNVRTVKLATSLEDNTLLTNTATISLDASLPLYLVDPDLIDYTAIDSVEHDAVTDLSSIVGVIKDYDDPTTERFIYITTARGYVTKNVVHFYYDKQFKDIIIIPDLRYTSVDMMDKNISLDIKGYRVGVFDPVDSPTTGIFPILDTKTQTRFQLPETNSNIGNIASINIIPGYYTRIGNNDAHCEEQLSNGINFYRIEGTPTMFVNLGTITDLFKDATSETKIPVYTFYQYSPEKHAITRVGVIHTDTRNIFVSLRF